MMRAGSGAPWRPAGGRLRLAAATALVAIPLGARADQGGASFWQSGSYAGYAAVPPSPGLALTAQFYTYTGTVGAAIQHGGTLFLGLGTQTRDVSLTPAWTPAATWLGGVPTLSLQLGGSWNRTQANAALAAVGGGGESIARSGSTVGGDDLSPTVQLAWAHGNSNWMAYVTGGLPTGAFQNSRLANTGLGHSAIDAGGAYTYANAHSGFEASATLGATHNGVNSQANYRSGLDTHLDWEVSQALNARVQFGIVGYVYHQLTADDGSGDRLGSFQSRVSAAGAEVSYAFTAGGQQWTANVRGYWEFDAVHRTQGHCWFATLNLPLWAPPPAAP